MTNETAPNEFLILGFSGLHKLQLLLFFIILATYIFILLGNTSILTVVCLDPQLHSPMYFFLGHLSFLDICYTTTNVPQILVHLMSQKKSITYAGCVTQLYFFVSLVGTECILLAAMAYDRFAAICHPLKYTLIMKKAFCVHLADACWVGGFLNSALHTYFTFDLPFCGGYKINYFFCDIPPLLMLSCGDTSLNEIILLVAGVFIGWTPFVCIILSYIYIISTIMKIQSNQGRIKAFSTCTSHLTIVILYYGSAIFTYVRPISTYSLEKDRLISVLYSIVTPMLNPLIYTLRNKDIKNCLKKIFLKVLHLR